jgi:hypothetical protein
LRLGVVVPENPRRAPLHFTSYSTTYLEQNPKRRPSGKGGAELPLPALRRQAPRWARGLGVDPMAHGSLPNPAHLGPICEKSRFQDVEPLLPKPQSYKP